MFYPVINNSDLLACSTELTIGASSMFSCIVGNYLYVSISSTNQFKIYDISDPCGMTLLSTTTTTAGDASLSRPRTISVTSDGNYAFLTFDYVALSDPTVASWDVSNKSSPSYITKVALTGAGGNLWGDHQDAVLVNDTTLYFVTKDSETGYKNRPLLKCNVSNPSSLGTPTGAFTYGTGVRIDGAQVIYDGRYIYTSGYVYTSGVSGNAFVSVMEESTGTVKSSLQTSKGDLGGAFEPSYGGMAIKGDYLYANVCSYLKCAIIDKSIITNINVDSFFDSHAGSGVNTRIAYRPAVDKLYIPSYNGANSANGIYIHSLNDPTNPSYVGNVSLNGDSPYDVLTRNNYSNSLYFTTWSFNQYIGVRHT